MDTFWGFGVCRNETWKLPLFFSFLWLSMCIDLNFNHSLFFLNLVIAWSHTLSLHSCDFLELIVFRSSDFCGMYV
jgi:hypothetical protein